VRGNCSQRPLPKRAYDPDRANEEYGTMLWYGPAPVCRNSNHACADGSPHPHQIGPSCMAVGAPTPVREGAAEFKEWWSKQTAINFKHESDIAIAFSAHQNAALRQELDQEAASHLVTIDDRDSAEDALQQVHIALGGDGEWVTRMPEPEPPESGDLRKDVPIIAAQIMEEAKRAQEAEDKLRAELADLRKERDALREKLKLS
jgi:hypothetical protein